MPLPLGEASDSWCTREDLNLHAVRRPLLRRLRLPFRHECAIELVPQRRIERQLPPYQSGALPLDDCGTGFVWCWLEDSNPRLSLTRRVLCPMS